MTGGLAGEHGRTEMNPRRYLRNLCSPGMAIIYNHHAKTGGAQLAVETHTLELPRFGGQFNIWGLNPTLVPGMPLLIFHR